jgi:antitoxin component YwqK of YwqJK toxin-antitoxin module
MKKLFILTMLVAIGGCSKEVREVLHDQTVKRDGLRYEIYSTTPFTGAVVSYYDNGQLEGRVHFKEGIPHGLTELYNEDGKLRFKLMYKDGIGTSTSGIRVDSRGEKAFIIGSKTKH